LQERELKAFNPFHATGKPSRHALFKVTGKETKIKLDAMSNIVYPMPITLIGSMLDGKPNFMPHGWIVRANYAPPIIAIGLGKIPQPHHTNLGIEQSKAFSVNYPGVGLIEKVDYCGTVSGKDVDKTKIFDVFYGNLKTAPMIRECSVTMECKVVNVVDMESSIMFFGLIEGAYSEESVMTDGQIDIKKLNPFVWTSPDENYWAVGEHLGKGLY